MKILLGSYAQDMALLEWQETESQLQKLPSHSNPSWLAYDKAHNLLFAVEEDADCGRLHSYRLGQMENQAELERLDSTETLGRYPCHILHIAARQQLWLCNYMGGPVSVFSYQDDGALSSTQTIRHRFTEPVDNPALRPGANIERQEMSHPHSCILAPDGRGLYCADLGYDQLVYHPLPTLDAWKTVVHDLPVGYGPRHMRLSADGRFLYALCELQPYLLSFQIRTEGCLELAAECRITRQKVLSQCSEICLHPELPYLYVANRNAGYVAQIQTTADGQLGFVAEFALASSNPRHIAISPNGEFLFAALQDSDQVQVFAIEAGRGTLRAHSVISFAKPAFIGFIT